MSSKRELRPYQRAIIDSSLDALKRGVKRQVVSAATGTGKTFTFSQLIPIVPSPYPGATKALVLAHRKELIDQSAEAIRRSNPDLKVAVEMAERKAQDDADVIVASVATIGMKDSSDPDGFCKRLKRMRSKDFKIIICDEGHHSAADSYKRVFKYFKADKPDCDVLLWACTATVRRSDGKPLAGIYDEIVYSFGLLEAISEGYLSNLRGVRVMSDVSLADVDVRMGDFADGSLSRAVNTRSRNELLYRAYMEHCSEGKRRATLVYCVDRQHASDVTDMLRSKGLHAEYVDGTTPSKEREGLLERFKQCQIPIIVSVGVLVEGTDLPATDAIIMARPTRSEVAYVQICGRATRKFEGKDDGLIIDIVDAHAGKSLVTMPSLLGSNPRLNMAGKTITEVHDVLARAVARNPAAADAEDLDEVVRVSSQVIDLFAVRDLPDDIKGQTGLAWIQSGEAEYRLALPPPQNGPSSPPQNPDNVRSHLAVREDAVGSWNVWLVDKAGREVIVRRHSGLLWALQGADAFVRSQMRDIIPVVSRESQWRTGPATQAQLDLLRKLRISATPGMTKGDASKVIDLKLAEIKVNGNKTRWQASREDQAGRKLQTRFVDAKVGKL